MIILVQDSDGKESITFNPPLKATDYILNGMFSLQTILQLTTNDRLSEHELRLITALIGYMTRYKFRSEIVCRWFHQLENIKPDDLTSDVLQLVEIILAEAKDHQLIKIEH